MSTVPAADSSDPQPIIANFKLPAFSTIDAAVWFKRAEVQFRLKNVRNARTQADHVLAALPDVLFPQMSEWLDSKGDDPIEYNELKTHLLRKFSLSPEQRVKAIFEVSRQPLGDQRPSDALTEMRALARLPPDSTGAARNIDVLRALWLHRLPETVRSSIIDFTKYDDSSIAELADQLLDAHLAATVTRPTAAGVPPDEAVADVTPDRAQPADDVVLAAFKNRRRNQVKQSLASFKPSRRPSSSQSSSSHKNSDFKDQLCFYHAKFGPKAQKCETPCAWPKNFQ